MTVCADVEALIPMQTPFCQFCPGGQCSFPPSSSHSFAPFPPAIFLLFLPQFFSFFSRNYTPTSSNKFPPILLGLHLLFFTVTHLSLSLSFFKFWFQQTKPNHSELFCTLALCNLTSKPNQLLRTHLSPESERRCKERLYDQAKPGQSEPNQTKPGQSEPN